MILLDIKAVSAQICMSDDKIRRMLNAGEFPKPVRVGGKVLWKAKDLEAWADNLDNEQQTKKGGRPRLAV